MQYLTILGATGSIGASTADVLLRHRDRFRVHALVGHRNVRRMLELAGKLHPGWVVMTDAAAAKQLRGKLAAGIHLAGGMEAAVEMAAAAEVDTVMAAMVGSAGLPAALAAVKAGKRVCLANKECLVTAGRIFMAEAAKANAEVVPVDSEHAAVHQCLAGHHRSSLLHVTLTASGGPFRDRDPASLAAVTVEEAVAHPNWDMGAKISVDSATMMNKALELIEARWLFGLKPEQLRAVIHPQSIVHALVAFRDGSLLAQLAEPDMRAPIAYALQHEPRLASGVKPLDFRQAMRLEFFPVDEQRFPAMRLVRDVLSGPDALAIAFNAANEVANQAFRERRLPFPGIIATVERVLERFQPPAVETLDQVWLCDAEARRLAEQCLAAAA